MREALLPLIATAFFAFFVCRWAGDELARDQRLSVGAATAVGALFVLYAMIVLLAALGSVIPIEAPPTVAFTLGAPVALAGASLTAWAAASLGSRERLLAVQIDRLITDGPYRRERHPFYAGLSLALLGAALAGRSALALGLVAIMIVALIRLARGEERMLAAALGPDYELYRDRTPALIGLRRRRRTARS